MSRAGLIVLAVGFALAAASSSARATPNTLSGTVTSGGSPVAGASVVASSGSASVGTVTDSNGDYSLGVDSGGYTLTASASGYAVGLAAVSVSGDLTRNFSLQSSGTLFSPLPVFGGATRGIYADGTSGVFYAQTSAIPQLYRTFDYGGTWAQVSSLADDPNGLPLTTNVGLAKSTATSGVPGEVATTVGNVYTSTNFGNTWSAIANTPPDLNFPRLYWGHVGSHDVLLAVPGFGTENEYVANLASPVPMWIPMTTPYGTVEDAYGVANGTSAPYVLDAGTGGGVTICPLTAVAGGGANAGCADETAIDLGGDAPFEAAMGGAANGSGIPRDLLVASDKVVAFSLDAGATWATTSTDCTNGGGNISKAVVAPNSDGSLGEGQIGSCFARDNGGTLTVTHNVGGNGFAFDAGWDGSTDTVAFGEGVRGPFKLTSVDGSGVPQYPADELTVAGSGLGSAGSSINGISAPVVNDTTFGPAGANEVAVTTSSTEGAISLASDDGGATDVVALQGGASTVDWWQGSGGHEWLVFGGYAGVQKSLAAIRDWTPETAALSDTNVTGSTSADLGAAGFVQALRGVPGTDTLFMGVNSDPNNDGDNVSHLIRGTLDSSPALSGATDIALPDSSKPIRAFAYCPASDTAALSDVLFVAQGGSLDTGGLLKITDATGGTPVVTTIASVAHRVNDVRADCASGTVYAGTGNTSLAADDRFLEKSTDGGDTFSSVTLPASSGGTTIGGLVSRVGLNPANPNDVLIAIGADGWILHSTDGGSTWNVVNDPSDGHNFLGNGVADLEYPPASAGPGYRPRTSIGQSEVLVGSGGGAYSANLRLAASGTGTMHASTTSVAAGASNTLTFTYRAATGGTYLGKVTLVVPTGWSAPQRSSSSAAGYVSANHGTVGVSGRTITVSRLTLPSAATVSIAYKGVKTTLGTSSFATKEASFSRGALKALSSSPSMTVHAAAASKFVVSSVPAHATAGHAFSVTVRSVDAYGNAAKVAAGKAFTLHVASHNGGGRAGTLSGNSGTIAAGASSATLTGVKYTKAETIRLSAGGGLTTSAASRAIAVAAGPAAKLVFTSSTANLAVGSTRQLVVRIEDASGNLVASPDLAVAFHTLISTGHLGDVDLSPHQVTSSRGVARVSARGSHAGIVEIDASADGGLHGTTSFAIVHISPVR